eukprot:4368046-Pleurochrysis_carterae.AAC.1
MVDVVWSTKPLLERAAESNVPEMPVSVANQDLSRTADHSNMLYACIDEVQIRIADLGTSMCRFLPRHGLGGYAQLACF